MAYIATGAQLRDKPHVMEAMFRMRKKVFHDILGWDVQTHGDMEHDKYDQDDTVYVIYATDDGDVVGTWRLLPTVKPYMLEEIWPEFADGYIPKKPTVWELSRWAVDHDKFGRSSFEAIAGNMFCTLAEFAQMYGIDEMIMLQDPKITPYSKIVFGDPVYETTPRPAGKCDAHVVSFTPAFEEKKRWAAQMLGLKLPVTQAFDILGLPTMAIAAE